MNIFSILTLLGGLAMFLYGMRMMGDGLKESSSGTLKRIMSKVTSNPFKAFLLGMAVTAIIQSSTATIVITSGLVAAGILSLHQSIGIIVGANVGTTITGQIIRLIDIDASDTSWLKLFQPSTLAPVALIIGIVLIMFINSDNSDKIGKIAIGFGILFIGLMTMTDAVDILNETGAFDSLFLGFQNSPLLGYGCGFLVAFILQSSSASIGILQALAISGKITFCGSYMIMLGIYLGDGVTTAIVCSIGAKADQKRVGIVTVLYNICKSLIIIIGVILLHQFGLLDWIWNASVNSGVIANVNTIFNLSSALLMFPLLAPIEKASCKIVKDDKVKAGKYSEILDQLNPTLFSNTAYAFTSAYDVILKMFAIARDNINRAFELVVNYDDKKLKLLDEEEEALDQMTDRVNNYLVMLSSQIHATEDVNRLDQYYKVVTEIERLGDHASNISEVSVALKENDRTFTEDAYKELAVMKELINRILDLTVLSFEKRDVEAAGQIEPLEEVVDDIVNALSSNHIARLRQGQCSVFAGTVFLNMLTDIERISDICSNIGVATVVRAKPEIENQVHDYISILHTGNDEKFNKEYQEAHDLYFGMLPN